jgi:hypothetical protein
MLTRYLLMINVLRGMGGEGLTRGIVTEVRERFEGGRNDGNRPGLLVVMIYTYWEYCFRRMNK